MADTVSVLFRFLHIAGASVGIGALVAVGAAAPRLRDDARAVVIAQAGKWIGIGLTLCVLAGLRNFSVDFAQHASLAYRRTLEVKGALGLLVYLGSIFTFHPAPAFRSFAQRRQMWIGILIAAAMITVALGAYLHGMYAPIDPTRTAAR